MFYKPTFVVILILSFVTVKGQIDCNDLYKHFFTDTKHKDVYHDILLMDKANVSCLISYIDKNQKTSVGFIDPKASTLQSFNFNNYIGIKAAYFIEFFLSKDSIETINGSEWEQKIKPYRIYKSGVIVKTIDGSPILETLSYKDMKRIKGIYRKWWNKNKNKAVNQLRKEWGKEKHILDGTCYIWI